MDDSLVRGTSSRAIIKALRKGGARKISLVITYPPIKFPCFAGIDFPSQEELATYTDGKDYSDEQIIEKVRNDIGADFLGYNDPENLAQRYWHFSRFYVFYMYNRKLFFIKNKTNF